MARVLMIEPYYGGSHKQLIDTLLEGLLSKFIVKKVLYKSIFLDLLTALGDAENPCFKLFSLPGMLLIFVVS